jgi:hypothetical protein
MIVFINNILLNSYLSVSSVCNPVVAKNMEIITLAETVSETNNVTGEKTVNITIYQEDLDYSLIKHEFVHYKQFIRKYWVSNSCKAQLGKMIHEIEANLAEDLPDELYVRIYGQYPKN